MPRPTITRKDIELYLAAKSAKQKADAISRSVNKDYKATKGKLQKAMRGKILNHPDATLILAEQSGAEPSITLADDTKIPWSSITRVLIGNKSIDATQVHSIYGGKSGSSTINVIWKK